MVTGLTLASFFGGIFGLSWGASRRPRKVDSGGQTSRRRSDGTFMDPSGNLVTDTAVTAGLTGVAAETASSDSGGSDSGGSDDGGGGDAAGGGD